MKISQHQILYLKDKAVLLSWVMGLLLLITLIWILTQPVQAKNLLRAVNNVFISNNDSRRLGEYLHVKGGKAGLLGYWYTINNSQDRIFVFGVFQNGILIPLGAVVSSDNKVEELIPLSAHAVQVFDEISESILKIYISRIEGTAAAQGEKR